MAVSLTTARHAVITLSQRREIREINDHLQKLLELDPLTGLLNKTAFQARAEARLARGGEALTLFMLDLDGFKAVNDVYGHPCGDFVLQEAGLRLRSVLPPDADIGRIGGDEFAALLPAPGGTAELERTGGRLIREISAIRWQERDVGAGVQRGHLPGRQAWRVLRAALSGGRPGPLPGQAPGPGDVRAHPAAGIKLHARPPRRGKWRISASCRAFAVKTPRLSLISLR